MKKNHRSIRDTAFCSILSVAMFFSLGVNSIAEESGDPSAAQPGTEVTETVEDPSPEPEPAPEVPAEAAAVTEPEQAPEATPEVTEEVPVAPEETAAPEPTPTEVKAEETAVPEETPAPAESMAPAETAVPEETAEPAPTPEATPDTEEESADIYMPAGSFSRSTSQMTVTVTYDDHTFPQGTTMRVSDVSHSEAMAAAEQSTEGDEEVIDAVAVDITFLNANNEEIQPEGAVSVSMVPYTPLETTETSTTEVIHKDDSGSVETVGNADVSASGAEFSAEHFSIYVISSTSPAPATLTYIFHGVSSDDNARQIVKNGDTVYAPKAPQQDGMIFLGWSKTEGATTINIGDGDPGIFSTITANVTNTDTINLYPVFQQAYYVFFLDKEGRVSTTKQGKTGDSITTSDVTIPLSSEEAVTGWYTDSGFSETSRVGDTVKLGTENVTLYPNVVKGHYVYFVTGEGAGPVNPQFVAANKTVQKPESKPERKGYDFVRWSSTDNGTDNYEFGTTITSDTTIYAVWAPKKDTKYTIIYWTQSVNDSKNATDDQKTYDYLRSEESTGTTGEIVNADGADPLANFKLNKNKSQPVTINGDGTTILNVYYDRNRLTINFNWKVEGHWENTTYSGLYGQTLAQNGYTWPSDKTWYAYKHYSIGGYGPRLTFLDAFIFDNIPEFSTDSGVIKSITLYAHDSQSYSLIFHYKQKLDGKYDDSSFDNKVSASGGTYSVSNKYTGFTVDSYCLSKGDKPSSNSRWIPVELDDVINPRRGQNIFIRYSRNKYELAFYNHGSIVRKEPVYYEAALDSYADYVPDKPDGYPEESKFLGWYKDPELTNPFNFNTTTMPTGGISIYAKWEKPVFEDTVHLSLNGGNDTISVDVPYGQKLNPSDMPTVVDASGTIVFEGGQQHIINLPKDTRWIGWSTKNGSDYRVWNMNQEVYQNIELYPYYISTKSFSVTYDLNGGAGIVPKDDNNYAQGSYAQVLSAKGITAPYGKVFLDWKAGAGNHYAPGDWIAINGDVKLIAQYGDALKNTEVRYHLNLGDDKTQTIQLDNNGIVAAIALPSEWETEGKHFVGWNTIKDGTGTAVNPGQNIMVYNDGNQQPIANDLYAQWKTELKISITGAENTVPYNGKKQELTGFTCKYEIGGQNVEKPAGTSVTWSKDAKTASGKDRGEYTAQLSRADFTFSDTEHYEVTFEITKDIILHIRKATVTLTSDSAEKEYDGKPLTNTKDPIVSGDGFAPGEGVTYSFTGSQTDVGESRNTFNYSLKENTKLDNYDITSVYGKLKITQSTKEIIVEIEGDQKEHLYDGKPHEASGYSVTKITQPESINYKYSDHDFTCTKLNLNVTGTDANTYKLGLVATDFQNSNNNFSNVTFKINRDAVLVIKPRNVLLTSATKDKRYDGTALMDHSVKVDGDGFVEGQGVTYSFTGSQTEVGSSENKFTYSWPQNTKASNYNIQLEFGTLTVTEKDGIVVTITGNTDSKVYDGSEKSIPSYTFKTNSDLYTADCFSYSGVTKITGTNAGVYPENDILSADQFKNTSTRFKDVQFVIASQPLLTITPRSITLKSADDSMTYNGTALTNHTVTVSEGSFADGEGASYTVTGSQTDAGESDNTFTYQLNDNTNAGNYNITCVPGKLTVNAISSEVVVTIKGNSTPSTEYNGTPQDVKGWTVKEISNKLYTSSNFTSNEDAIAQGTDAGTYWMGLKPENFVNTSKNFTNVRFVVEDGKLVITPRKVHLKARSGEKEYDGEPLTVVTVDPAEDSHGFVEGEVSNIRATGTITTVGKVNNPIEYDKNKETYKDKNYVVTLDPGWLTVKKNTSTIKITAGSGEKKYDGIALTNSNVTYSGLPNKFTLVATVVGSVTNVEDNKPNNNKVTEVHIYLDKEDVTGQFDEQRITIVAGALKINPRQVTLTSESASKAYDGTALTRPDVKIEGDGFVDGEVSGIKAAGTITTVDTIKNTITYEPGKKFKETNYVITKKEGTLEIFQNEKAIVVTAKNAEKKYDGKPLTDDRAEVTGLPKDHMAEVTVSGTITDAGKVDNTVKKVVIKNAEGKDVTNQFKTITKNKGTLTISKRNVTLTSEGGSKPYDGTALTKPTVTVGGDGFVDGEVKDLKATGTVTSVSDGEVENKIVYTPTSKFKPDNYSIEMNLGKLSITKADIADKKMFTVSQPSNVVYNGLDQKQPVTVTRITPKATNAVAKLFLSLAAIVNVNADEALKVGTDYTLTYSKNLKDVGTVTVTVKGLGNYTGEVTRKYQITPAPLKVTTSSAEKVYDGKALTATGKLEGIVDADKTLVTLTVKGSQTEVGSSVNDYEINWGNVRKENYSLTESLGTLKVTARPEPSKPKPAASNPAPAPVSTRFIPRTAANPAEGK